MAIRAADLEVRITADASQAQGVVENFNGMLSSVLVGNKIQNVGDDFLDFSKDFIMAGANFEEQMTIVDQIIGGTISHIETLKKEALLADIFTMYDAMEVAAGFEMLARAGFDVTQIIGAEGQHDGMIAGLLAFAAATRTDVSAAGQIFSATMRIFSESGYDAIEMSDLLTQAILRSGKTADQMGIALQYVGAISQQFGTDPREIVTIIALLESLGIRSMSVGTGLRSLYDGIATESATIEALGIQLYSINDAGEKTLLPLMDIVDQFNAKIAGMDPDAAYKMVEDIFGKPAASPLMTLFTTGSERFPEFADSMLEVGSAGEIMDARMNTLKGSLEILSATWFGFKKQLGDSVSEYIKPVVDGLTVLVNVLQNAPPFVHKLIAGFVILGGLLLNILGGAMIFKAVGGMQLLTSVLGMIATAALPVIAILTLLGLAIAAIATDFGGIRTWLVGVGEDFLTFASHVSTAWEMAKQFKGVGDVEAGIRAIGSALGEWIFGEDWIKGSNEVTDFMKSVYEVAASATDIDEGLGRIANGIRGIGKAFKEGGLRGGFDEIFGRGGERILTGLGEVIGGIPNVIGELMVQMDWGPLDPAMAQFGRAGQRMGQAIEAAFAGDWDRVWANIKAMVRRSFKGGVALGRLTVKVLSWGFEQAVNLYDELKEAVFGWAGGKTIGSEGGTRNSYMNLTGAQANAIDIGTVSVQVSDWAVSAWDGSIAESLWNNIWGILTDEAMFNAEDVGTAEDLGAKIGEPLGKLFAKGVEFAIQGIIGSFSEGSGMVMDVLSGKMKDDPNSFRASDLMSAFLKSFFASFDDGADQVFDPYKQQVKDWWDRKWGSLLDIFSSGGSGDVGASQDPASPMYNPGRDFSFMSIIKGILKIDEWAIEELGLPDFGASIRSWANGQINTLVSGITSNRLWKAAAAISNGDIFGALELLGGSGGSGSGSSPGVNGNPLVDDNPWGQMPTGPWVDPWYGEEHQGPIPQPVSRDEVTPLIEVKPRVDNEQVRTAVQLAVQRALGNAMGGKSDRRNAAGGAASGFSVDLGPVGEGMTTTLIGGLSSLGGRMSAAAQAAMGLFTGALGAGFRVAANVADLGSTLVWWAAHVPSLYDEGYSTGVSLGAGIAAGIRSMLGEVAAARNELINAGGGANDREPTPSPGGPSAAGVTQRDAPVVNQTNHITMSLAGVQELVAASNFVASLDTDRQVTLGRV
jgi:TP901 family phage tail tape measure protein